MCPQVHIAIDIFDGGVVMCLCVVEELLDACTDIGDSQCCAGGEDATEYGQHCEVYRVCIVEEDADELLNLFEICGGKEFRGSWGCKLLFGAIFGWCPGVREML